MTYLYGDSSDSGLELNYIELLRDFLDFAVQIMLSEHRIDASRLEAEQQKQMANSELERLRALEALVFGALDSAKSPNMGSSTDKSIAALRQLTQDTLRRAAEALKAQVTSNEQQIQVSRQRERSANAKIAERLLLHHTLPDSQNTVDIIIDSEGAAYQARIKGACKEGLRWLFAAKIPNDNKFHEVIKISNLEPELCINLPEMSGFVRKSVKLKPYRVSPLYITAIQDEGQDVVLKLRSASSGSDTTGLDIRLTPVARRVSVLRINKGEKSDPFQVADDDAAALLQICDQLKADRLSLVEQRVKLLSIRFDGKELSECPDPKVMLKRLIDRIGPVIQNIANNSLAETELILKRVLANDRREEIFASKADLIAKLSPVPLSMRGMFAPLGLGDLGTGRADPSVNGGPAIDDDPPTKPLTSLAGRRAAVKQQAGKNGRADAPTLENQEDSRPSMRKEKAAVQEIVAMAPDENEEDANLPPIPSTGAERVSFRKPPAAPKIPPLAGAPRPEGDSIDVALAELDAEG